MSPDLHTIYRVQPAAKLLFDWIRRSGVEDNRTTVEELIEHLDVPRKAAINLLRALAEAGHGEFKVGRKGHPSRLEWSDDPQALADHLNGGDEPAAGGPNPGLDVARSNGGASGGSGSDEDEDAHDHEANGRDPEPDGRMLAARLDLFADASDHDQPLPVLADGIARVVTHSRRRAPTRGAELIEHSYVLRPELRIVLALPEDLSAREAEVLGDWIRNLSFER